MQPRTLDQVNASLANIYDPQVQSVQQEKDSIPGQVQSEEQGLQAKQNTAFGDILDGARARGLGFSGIPLGEQAKYTANTYLPALANLHTAAQQHVATLQDAINKINETRQTQAQGIFENERNFAEQQRQFNETLAQQKANAAASASGGLGGAFNFGGGSQTPATPAQQAPANDPYAKIDKTGAQNSIKALLATKDVARINREYNAIKASAGYGNVFDQYKMGLLSSVLQPQNNQAYNPANANLLKSAMSYKAPAQQPANWAGAIGNQLIHPSRWW